MTTRKVRLGPVMGEVREIPLNELELRPDGPVTLADREGVFAHFLKCPADGAEFVTLSWRLLRPAEVAYGCPECNGGVNYMGTVTLSTRREFSLRSADLADPAYEAITDVEIYCVGRILGQAAEAPSLRPLHD